MAEDGIYHSNQETYRSLIDLVHSKYIVDSSQLSHCLWYKILLQCITFVLETIGEKKARYTAMVTWINTM